MNLSIEQIAEAFCSHRFEVTYPTMAEEIIWKMVGGEELSGRAAVMDRCAQAAKFLETVRTTSLKLKVIGAKEVVVVEGAAQFVHPDGHTSSVASCDVFRFSDERLVGITSYVIELGPSPWPHP